MPHGERDHHIDWWRDGKVVTQLLTMVLGFIATILTVRYQAVETREKVYVIQEQTDEVKKEAQTNAQRIEAIHRDVKDTNIRMSLPPNRPKG